MEMARTAMFLMVIIVLCLGVSEVDAAYTYIDFCDGGVHEINSSNSTGVDDIVRIDYGYPGIGTTVNLVLGGKIGYCLDAFENSNFTMSGGEIATHLSGSNDSHITISGGEIGEEVLCGGNSQVTISGGHIGIEINAYMNSQITFSGGTIGYDLRANGYSHVIISGGQVAHELWATQNSIMTVYGSDFSIDGLNVGYGPITATSGILTGALASGEMLNNNFYIYENASIILVPEPATVFLLGLGCLALRRRRKA